ncbi:MAG TPA: type II secretion system F family protein [Xanthobacteraceae bacterium]|nr:type II secretion system F family protein [Xanthobacteraceae bacterium]
METLSDLLAYLPLGPGPALSLLVFAATASLAFGVMASLRVRANVRRRAAGVRAEGRGDERRSLRHASVKAAHRLADYTNRHFSGDSQKSNRLLRSRLIQAGFLDARAATFYFLARALAAAAFGAAAMFAVPIFLTVQSQVLWTLVWLAACIGYMAPKVYLDRRIASRRDQHRAGFPDFMDLLVVCANAGLSMEAALDRVGRELSDTYPSLSGNLYMTNLELRAGRTLGEALEHLADRLGLEEARQFATLLQQSEELGSSLTDTLRVYSEVMRHKRMSIAEEKAYSLPAKLSVPLILCIFPVIIIVIMLPVYVRVKFGIY